MGHQVDPFVETEADAFLLEQRPLQWFGAELGTGAHPPLGIHDPLPGHAAARAKRVKGISDLARMSAQTGQLGHLSVGGDATLGDPAHHGIDLLVAPRALHPVHRLAL